MRRKTYAHNSVILGLLVALYIWASSGKTALAIAAFIAISVIGFLLIRAAEKALYKGADKAVDAVADAIKKKKNSGN